MEEKFTKEYDMRGPVKRNSKEANELESELGMYYFELVRIAAAADRGMLY